VDGKGDVMIDRQNLEYRLYKCGWRPCDGGACICQESIDTLTKEVADQRLTEIDRLTRAVEFARRVFHANYLDVDADRLDDIVRGEEV
jgi:hypothetical protein